MASSICAAFSQSLPRLTRYVYPWFHSW